MITLKPLTETDLPFLLEVRNDDSTRSMLENNKVFNIEQCLVWFNKLQPKWYIIKTNNQPVGYIRTNKDEVGCDIHPNFRRKGYARMAYKIYLKDKDYASLWVFEDNFAKKLYKDLGFIETNEVKFIRNKKYLKMNFSQKTTPIVNYIVSLYGGERRFYKTTPLKFFIKKHISFIKTKPYGIKYVTFVFNESNHPNESQIKENLKYEFKEIETLFPDIKCTLLSKKNQNFSYGAWDYALHHFIKNDEITHHFLIEDDYIPTLSDFIIPFLEKDKENPSYVASLWTASDPSQPPHASISNGLLNHEKIKKTFKKYNKIFNLFFDPDKLHGKETYDDGGFRNQIHFLKHLQELFGEGTDITDHYNTWFAVQNPNQIIIYGSPFNKTLIAPIFENQKPLFNSRLKFLML